jgi:hypothetical protein
MIAFGNGDDDDDAPERPKLWWQAFLESSGGAALITVAIGGLLAQWINVHVQTATTEREFNNAWLRARGDQALTAYRDYSNEQLKLQATSSRLSAKS